MALILELNDMAWLLVLGCVASYFGLAVLVGRMLACGGWPSQPRLDWADQRQTKNGNVEIGPLCEGPYASGETGSRVQPGALGTLPLPEAL